LLHVGEVLAEGELVALDADVLVVESGQQQEGFYLGEVALLHGSVTGHSAED